MSSTRWSASSRTPTRDDSLMRASRTSRARLPSGNSLPSASSCSRMPISRKNVVVSATGNPRRTRRTIVDRPPQKSRSETTTLVTLQREPPLMRIFAPGFLAPSSRTMERVGLKRRLKMAVARPAAPAPTIATSHDSGSDAISRSRALPLEGDALEIGHESADERFEFDALRSSARRK